jgi:hypothetical protein
MEREFAGSLLDVVPVTKSGEIVLEGGPGLSISERRLKDCVGLGLVQDQVAEKEHAHGSPVVALADVSSYLIERPSGGESTTRIST